MWFSNWLQSKTKLEMIGLIVGRLILIIMTYFLVLYSNNTRYALLFLSFIYLATHFSFVFFVKVFKFEPLTTYATVYVIVNWLWRGLKFKE